MSIVFIRILGFIFFLVPLIAGALGVGYLLLLPHLKKIWNNADKYQPTILYFTSIFYKYMMIVSALGMIGMTVESIINFSK
jgi:hypothetical protein